MRGDRKRVLAAAVAAAALAAGCGQGDAPDQIPQASAAQLEAAGLDELSLAPASKRVDLAVPSFSSPTEVTNPLFPISRLRSTILTGQVDGEPFKAETTLLPETRIFEWPEGRPVETLVSQYVAYVGGRLAEVALDYYAQADDGAVWYFGEDVFNYRDGVVADTEGTWLAGRDGPAAMIMPARPRVGDVYRPENVPGLVFEEVTVAAVEQTVQGPTGAVAGALVARELHQDGAREAKTFAPGYGEFFTGAGGDVEAMSLALPQDAAAGAVPPELEAVSARAAAAARAARAQDWAAAAAAARRARAAWGSLGTSDLPDLLRGRLGRAVQRLSRAVAAHDSRRTGGAALEVAEACLDLKLRYQPAAEIDRERFELWAHRVVVDAEAGDAAGVAGDVATLEWIRDRFAHTLAAVERTRLDAQLAELRAVVTDEDLRGSAVEAAVLLDALAR